MKTIEQQVQDFETLYYDKGTPSGLKDKEFNHMKHMMDSARQFLIDSLEERDRIAREAGKDEAVEIMEEELELSCVDDRLLGKSDEYLEGYNTSTERWREKRDNIIKALQDKK